MFACIDYSVFSTDVYNQRNFTYTGKEDHLLWEAYGINLHFPSHSSDVTIEGKVRVLSIDNEKCEFPEESELVSAVYDISSKELFPVPVTVQLQHSIPLQDDNKTKRMSFVIDDTQQGPPYVFSELCGGDFKCGSSYGQIQLRHFCKLGVIIKRILSRPIPFYADIYYTQNDRANFVVTQNLEAHINVSSV